MVLTNTNGTRPTRQRGRGRTGQPRQTVLKTGLSVWSGQVKEEYLSALSPWSRAIKVYQEMQHDVVIGALFEAVKTPLLASPFEVAAASDSVDDVAAKQFVEDNLLNNPSLDWPSHVSDSLEFLDIGFAISEKVLEKRSDGRLYLRDLMPIGQDTLDKWGENDDFGRPTSFIQRDERGRTRAAVFDKLLHFVSGGHKRNPQGEGLLRSLYRPWFFKKNLETIEAIGAERDVGNAPVVSLKEGVRYSDADITNLEKALEGFRMDEAVYVIMPGGASITAYGGGNKVYDIRSIIRDWQHLIRQRFFADFLSFGSENVGTQALAREMTTFFGLAERSIQQKMLAVWNKQLIPWLFKWNNITMAQLPKLTWLRPGDQNLQSLAQAYNTLIGAGMLDPNDDEMVKRVRNQIGLNTTQNSEFGSSALWVPGQSQHSQYSQFESNPQLVLSIIDFVQAVVENFRARNIPRHGANREMSIIEGSISRLNTADDKRTAGMEIVNGYKALNIIEERQDRGLE